MSPVQPIVGISNSPLMLKKPWQDCLTRCREIVSPIGAPGSFAVSSSSKAGQAKPGCGKAGTRTRNPGIHNPILRGTTIPWPHSRCSRCFPEKYLPLSRCKNSKFQLRIHYKIKNHAFCHDISRDSHPLKFLRQQ
jgi:hypothetical protein